MIQISKKIGAAVKAQRSLQATHRFHIAFSNPPVVSHQAGIRRRTPTVEAFSIQGYDQPSRQTSTINMLTMSSADPERYRPVGLMGDDPAATRVLYAGRSWDSFPGQPEGIQEQHMAMASFDAASPGWNLTRRDFLREPDLSGEQATAVMTPYGLLGAGQGNALDIEEWIQEPFENSLALPKPELDMMSTFPVRPVSKEGGAVSSDTFGLASPDLDVEGWMDLPESVIEFQPMIPGGARGFLVGVLIASTRKDIPDRIQPTKAPGDALDMAVQLDTLRTLKNGWADGLQPAQDWGNGYGTAPNHEGLDWLAGQFERFYASSLPRPYLYPTPLGGVQAEWLEEPYDASLEIDLESHSAEWHCLNLGTKISTVEDLNLDKAEAWEWLSTEVQSLGSATE